MLNCSDVPEMGHKLFRAVWYGTLSIANNGRLQSTDKWQMKSLSILHINDSEMRSAHFANSRCSKSHAKITVQA